MKAHKAVHAIHLPGSPFDLPIVVKLAGVTFGDAQGNIRKYGGQGIAPYELIREPGNPEDPNAISVKFLGHYFMGYIPAEVAQDLAPMIDEGRDLVAEFVSLNQSTRHSIIGINVKIVEFNHYKEQNHAA